VLHNLPEQNESKAHPAADKDIVSICLVCAGGELRHSRSRGRGINEARSPSYEATVFGKVPEAFVPAFDCGKFSLNSLECAEGLFVNSAIDQVQLAVCIGRQSATRLHGRPHCFSFPHPPVHRSRNAYPETKFG
jgi:hypothetical protein